MEDAAAGRASPLHQIHQRRRGDAQTHRPVAGMHSSPAALCPAAPVSSDEENFPRQVSKETIVQRILLSPELHLSQEQKDLINPQFI